MKAPGARHTEPTHQPGLHGQQPPPLPWTPPVSVRKGRLLQQGLHFLQTSAAFSSLGEQEARPSVAEPGWRGALKPALHGAGAGAGQAGWPRVSLCGHTARFRQWRTPALRSCVQSAGRSVWLALPGVAGGPSWAGPHPGWGAL